MNYFFLYEAIYKGSMLVFPLLVFLIYAMAHLKIKGMYKDHKLLFWSFFTFSLLSLLFIEMRFVQPYHIVVKHEEIDILREKTDQERDLEMLRFAENNPTNTQSQTSQETDQQKQSTNEAQIEVDSELRKLKIEPQFGIKEINGEYFINGEKLSSQERHWLELTRKMRLAEQDKYLTDKIRIAVVADIHLGIFKGKSYLYEIVQMVNQYEPDIVVLPGDFVFFGRVSELKDLLLPLKQLNARKIYGILGNHDYGDAKGELDLSTPLVTVLEDYGVNMIDNDDEDVIIDKKKLTLVGVGSMKAKNDKYEKFDLYEEEDNVIALVHNPDAITNFPEGVVDFTIAGHTHCGQIRIPGYKSVIPTKGDFDKGLTKEENTLLYITCGLGEVKLPMRFLNYPEISILDIY